MEAYLVEQHKENGVHWLVSADSPNSGNALDCGPDKDLAKCLVDYINGVAPPQTTAKIDKQEQARRDGFVVTVGPDLTVEAYAFRDDETFVHLRLGQEGVCLNRHAFAAILAGLQEIGCKCGVIAKAEPEEKRAPA